MFESVVPDRGSEGITRAARIFYVLSILITISSILATFIGPFRPTLLAINAVFVIAAWLTARGIEQQKRWSKWAGYTLGIFELFNFPIGTIVGVAVLVHIYRASRAGLFNAT